jgi:6-phosphogluconolactonase
LFSKKGRYVYVLQELEVWWSFLFERKVEKIDQTTILANGFKGTTGADHISPDENFYASNRGEANTISTFRILKTEN